MSKVGLEEKEKRDKELASFMAGHKEACRKNQQVSVEKIKEYEELKVSGWVGGQNVIQIDSQAFKGFFDTPCIASFFSSSSFS